MSELVCVTVCVKCACVCVLVHVCRGNASLTGARNFTPVEVEVFAITSVTQDDSDIVWPCQCVSRKVCVRRAGLY